MYLSRRTAGLWKALALAGVAAAPASAQELNPGDTAWVLVASGLVLFMMIPGLAMFYGGLVRSRNVLSVFMQCFAITAGATVIWILFGYSIAFDPSGMVADEWGLNAFIGGFSRVMLSGIGPETMRGTIPEILFVVFQLTFAAITPGLIVGAFAERMKFSAMFVFSMLWLVLAYLPICHMVWGGPGSFFGDLGVIDFAGGIVVHITAGVSALVAAIMIGKRKGYPEKPMPPHNLTMTLTGTGMLWVGWFGFNGGSQLAADGKAAMAVMVTQISPCVAALVWVVIERLRNGKPSALGLATGAIAGLAAITPASGSVGPMGAIVIGLASGVLCYLGATSMKRAFGYDDALDVVGVHGVGGLVGTLLVAVLGARELGGFVDGLDIGRQLGVQAFAAGVALVYCATVTAILLKVIDATIGLRVTADQEMEGLDLADHGEAGYDL